MSDQCSCWARLLLQARALLTKQPLPRTGRAPPPKTTAGLHPHWTASTGKWEFRAASSTVSASGSPIRPSTDLQSLWINCIFQGLIKLSWASAWRGTNWHLQRFLKPAVDITVPAAFSCIDPMPDLWNPWWLLTLEAYWSFPRELQDSLCSQVQLPVPPGEPISSQRAGAEQMFCVWFRILKKKALFCLILLFLILWLLLRSWQSTLHFLTCLIKDYLAMRKQIYSYYFLTEKCLMCNAKTRLGHFKYHGPKSRMLTYWIFSEP